MRPKPPTILISNLLAVSPAKKIMKNAAFAKLKHTQYVGLTDALHVRTEQEKLRVGRIVILPSSFIGSPRNAMRIYQDAMAIVRKFAVN